MQLIGGLTEIDFPQWEPIGIAAARCAIKLEEDDTSRDTELLIWIASARAEIENRTRKRLVARTFEYTLGVFPYRIRLPIAPLQSVISITYIDTAGALQTVPATDYVIDRSSHIPRIVPVFGKVWPPSQPGHPTAVTVRFVAGYLTPFSADDSTNVLTAASHGLITDQPFRVSNHSGALPSALISGTTYYARDVTASTLKVAATVGGAAIDLGSPGSEANFIGVIPAQIHHAMTLMIREADECGEVSSSGSSGGCAVSSAIESLLGPVSLPQV